MRWSWASRPTFWIQGPLRGPIRVGDSVRWGVWLGRHIGTRNCIRNNWKILFLPRMKHLFCKTFPWWENNLIYSIPSYCYCYIQFVLSNSPPMEKELSFDSSCHRFPLQDLNLVAIIIGTFTNTMVKKFFGKEFILISNDYFLMIIMCSLIITQKSAIPPSLYYFHTICMTII